MPATEKRNDKVVPLRGYGNEKLKKNDKAVPLRGSGSGNLQRNDKSASSAIGSERTKRNDRHTETGSEKSRKSDRLTENGREKMRKNGRRTETGRGKGRKSDKVGFRTGSGSVNQRLERRELIQASGLCHIQFSVQCISWFCE